MGRLTNKVALISGAARGQGRADAQRLAAEGERSSASMAGTDDTIP